MIATDRESLLAGIVAAPEDDAPRLVFADWLDEYGEPERAEFIRVQCELARLEAVLATPYAGQDLCESVSATWCPVCGDCTCPEPEESRNHPNCPLHAPTSRHAGDDSLRSIVDALRRRERALLAADWCSVKPARTSRRLAQNAIELLNGDGFFASFTFHRGFVEQVRFARLDDAIGGPCGRCGGRSAGVQNYACDPCGGTGRTPGLLPAVLRACPLVRDVTEICETCGGAGEVSSEDLDGRTIHKGSCRRCGGSGSRMVRRGVEVVDREPFNFDQDGRASNWYDETEVDVSDGHPPSNLPHDVFERLEGWTNSTPDRKRFASYDLARDALSAALLDLVRSPAGVRA